MQRQTLITFIKSIFIFLFLAVLPKSLSGQTLAEDGRSTYSIILGSEASPSEKHGAAELRGFLQMISGAFIPIRHENESVSGPCIFVGDGRVLRDRHGDLGISSLANEEYIIKTMGDDLILAGGRLRGSMYAVYGFLEDILGCRWYTSRVSRIPGMDRIVLKPLDIRAKPYFEYREPFWKDAFEADWAARNRCNSTFAELDAARGGRVNYRGIHTFNRLIPPEKYLENHPEYFSISERKRQWNAVHSQLCLTNAEVRKALIPNLVEWIESDPEGTIFDVSQNDGDGNCQCGRCLALDSLEGSPSGALLRFVNPVADYIKARYPDKSIATFAYAFTLKPPRITRPRDFMIIRLCTSISCHSHPIAECSLVKEFYENLSTWGTIAGKIYVWDYLTDFHHYLYPQPDIRAQIANIKLFAENRVSGIFAQGDYTSLGGSLAYLEAYLEAKLLWNPRRNADGIIDDFLAGYYGNAAPAIRRYIDLIEEKVARENVHVWMANPWNITEYMTPELMKEAETIFAEARRLADNPEIAERVEEASIPLRYVRLTLPRPREIHGNVSLPLSPAGEGLREALDFFSLTERHGIEEYREGSGTEALSDFILANVDAHEIVTLANDKIECRIIPGLGGRMINLAGKESGKEVLYQAGTGAEWYPVAGGIPVSGWETTKFTVNDFLPGNRLILSARRPLGRKPNALLYERCYTLLQDAPGVEIATSFVLNEDSEMIRRYSFSPEFAIGEVRNLNAVRSADGTSYGPAGLPAENAEGIRTMELFYPEIKWGYWGLCNEEGEGVVISFDPQEIDYLSISADPRTNRVRFSIRASGTARAKGDKIAMKQRILVVKNFEGAEE